MQPLGVNRREFLRQTAWAAGFSVAQNATATHAQGVSIVVDPADPIASAPPARWAVRELEQPLAAQGVPVRYHQRVEQTAAGDFRIVVAGATVPLAREILGSMRIPTPSVPEAVGLVPGRAAGKAVLLACGSDVRGLVYALLELADRVNHAEGPVAALNVRKPLVETPANVIRGVNRCFQSDIEDKPWYSDRSMWPPYLSMLADQRFNRFSLTFGLGYDFTRNISDSYFHFAYPFLVSVPGYDVRAAGLPEGERERNLEMLRFISDQTAERGLDFQLGLWTHAYRWTDSPNANYTIEGLAPENHAAYCREALRKLLEACPAINGVTFRIHGESGIPEGSYTFWKEIFEGVARTGRRIEINLHAKGIDQATIDSALATGMPVTVSPKYWAEHMGLPYHQASIRELEMPPRDRKVGGFFALSSGSRKFLRYGYGDLLTEDRRYGILYRIWPGTQRVLLWGDPAMAAAYGRASSFCGGMGLDLFEPLSFKGRRGSGIAGGRCAYADASLHPKFDWEKYLYTYRVWGRLIYNPDAEPETWRQFLRKQFQAAAPVIEAALAHGSRILPLITTAHGASGANNTYWPEVYTNMPIVDPARKHPYGDTPTPRVFGNVSSFDPEIFLRVNDFAEELLKPKRSGKYSPLQVARWLEGFATAAAKHLAEAASRVGDTESPEYRRMATDVNIQNDLGRFFAWKLRSGVLYALHERTGDRGALLEALAAYRKARAAWTDLATRANGAYALDITYGPEKHLRGHWVDRLAAIDDDIADMEKRLDQVNATGTAAQRGDIERAVHEALAEPRPPSVPCQHTPATHFHPGQPLDIEILVENGKTRERPITVRLHYRHVNQAELYHAEGMEARDNRYRAVIPADYTQSPYPLAYFFELHDGPNVAWLYPGFEPDLCNQPYFVARRI